MLSPFHLAIFIAISEGGIDPLAWFVFAHYVHESSAPAQGFDSLVVDLPLGYLVSLGKWVCAL